MNEYIESAHVGSPNHYPLQPDEWPVGGWRLQYPDAFDVELWGKDVLRVETGHKLIPTLPVIITITGKDTKRTQTPGTYKIRVKIEFCNDEEPSTFSGGWLYIWR